MRLLGPPSAPRAGASPLPFFIVMTPDFLLASVGAWRSPRRFLVPFIKMIKGGLGHDGTHKSPTLMT